MIVNGEFKWRLSELFPLPGKSHAFGQYYVLAPEQEVEARIAADPNFRPNLSEHTIEELTGMKCNERCLRTVMSFVFRDIPSMPSIRLPLLHCRREAHPVARRSSR